MKGSDLAQLHHVRLVSERTYGGGPFAFERYIENYFVNKGYLVVRAEDKKRTPDFFTISNANIYRFIECKRYLTARHKDDVLVRWYRKQTEQFLYHMYLSYQHSYYVALATSKGISLCTLSLTDLGKEVIHDKYKIS